MKSKFQVSSISRLSCMAKKPRFVRSFFGRIYRAPICFWFYLTFSYWMSPLHNPWLANISVVNISGNATHVRTVKATFKICTLQMLTGSHQSNGTQGNSIAVVCEMQQGNPLILSGILKFCTLRVPRETCRNIFCSVVR